MQVKYNDLIKKINYLNEMNNKTIKQANIMFIPLTKKVLFENGDKEVIVQFDIENVVEDFLYNEKKTIFFINQFLKEYLEMLLSYKNYFKKNNSCFCTNQYCEKMTYYFDSFVASFSTIIEPDQKEVLSNYLNKNEINKFYPSRDVFGLYWQIYMIRNRILHFTKKRYSYERKECFCYENFSSKIKTIQTDDNGNINIFSTLIDIYSDENIKKAINTAIKDRTKKPFELLFPNTSAKGYSKKKPYTLHITNNIFFNYATSALDLIEEIEKVFDKTNTLFVNYLTQYYTDIEELKQSKTKININGSFMEYSISDVFKI